MTLLQTKINKIGEIFERIDRVETSAADSSAMKEAEYDESNTTQFKAVIEQTSAPEEVQQPISYDIAERIRFFTKTDIELDEPVILNGNTFVVRSKIERKMLRETVKVYEATRR